MTLREVFRFELGYQLRRASTWLYAGVLLALTFYLTAELSVDYARTDGSYANGPFIVAALCLLCSAPGLLMACALAGDAAARDVESRMGPLLFAAPLGKFAYLGGRFLAAFTLHALILVAVPLGALLAAAVGSADLLGPFRPTAYLGAYLALLLPNAFAATAVLFSAAVLCRRAAMSYLAALVLVGVSAFSWASVAGMSNQWAVARMLDPLGATILGELSMAWTPAERSTRAVALHAALVSNRVLWTGVALGVLALTWHRFRFAHHVDRVVVKRRASPIESTWPGDAVPRPAPEGRPTFGYATRSRQLLAVAWSSFRAIATGWGGLVLIVTASFLVFSAIPFVFMGVPMFATAERITAALAAPLASPPEINWIVIPLLIAFCAGELAWREREAGLSDIADATPVPEWVRFAGLFVGLSLGLVALQALMLVAGSVGQRLLGDLDLEPGLYARTLFGLQLADYLLFALLALAVHALVHHKYIGHLIVLVAYGFMVFGPALGVEHNLLVYGSDPGWSYSDMRGFQPFIAGWLWFKLYWAAWGLLLAVAATLVIARGRNVAVGARFELARVRATRRMAGLAAAALGLVVTLGGFVFYNTNVLNAYQTAAGLAASRAEYERRYGQYRSLPQPQLEAASLKVDIHPERREIEVQGTLQLLNTSANRIDAIHLSTNPNVDTTEIQFDRPAKEVRLDKALGYRIHTLETPLGPGETVRLQFGVRGRQNGFPNRGIDASVVPNGTHFDSGAWLPAIGYQAGRELRAAGARQAAGLTARPETPVLEDEVARLDGAEAVRIHLETVVATDVGQVAVAPGRLRRTWTVNGRRYFHYATDAPIRNDYALYSAAYALHTGGWNDTSIEILHHPAHAWNVDRMMRSVQASLDRYTKHFGPYPHRQVRLVEHPGDGVVLHAAPVNISFDEGFALLNPAEDPRDIDLPFAVVAHEVAHQWWGNTLTPAPVEGAGLLTESLAWYSALEVVEETFGREHLQRLLGLMRQAYLMPRSRADVPLLRASGAFLAYRKGPLAMYALREYVGAGPIRDALRRLLDTHRDGTPPLPTSLDLYRELQSATPESLQYLLADLFEANTFWELATERVTAQQTGSGEWQVTLDVVSRKVTVDTADVETEIPMNDLVEVGVFKDEGPGDPIYLQHHRVRSGRQRITMTVPQTPARAGIDPRRLLIDMDGDDNVKTIAVTR